MGEKKQKAYLNNWPFLFFLFVVVSLVLMLRLLADLAVSERAEVEERFMGTVENYAVQLRDILTDMRDQGKTVGFVAGEMEADNEAQFNSALFSVADNNNNYLAVLCEVSGKAIYKVNGEESVKRKNMSSLEYFEEITRFGKGYIYVGDDGITGKSAIVCVSYINTAGKRTGFFLQYYDVEQFRNIAKRADFGTESQIFVVDGDGNVMAYTGLDDNYLDEEHNLWEELKEKGVNNEGLEQMIQVLESKTNSVNYVDAKGGERVYVCSRIGILDWSIVTELTGPYVEKQVDREWSATRNAIVQVIILTAVFGGIVLVINIVAVATNRENEASLEAKADTDLLTDLYNKAATERKIREYIGAHPNEQALMFVLDIDNFKKINDTMGHAFGDEVLRAVGTMIKTEFRASDIIGRTGGDEFTIFLKNVKEEEELKKQVERILRFFSNLQVGEYVKYSPNASIGAAVFPRDAGDFENLYKAADAALYVAKKRGKNQLAFYGDDK